MNLETLRYASRFDGVTGSAIREIFKMIAKPGMISFAGGNPSPAALPDDVVDMLFTAFGAGFVHGASYYKWAYDPK